MLIREKLDKIRGAWHFLKLPPNAKEAHRRDRSHGLEEDPGIDQSVKQAIAWLCRAQDESITSDGGVARHYSLINGWGPSYPETTGYIIPTIIEYAEETGDDALLQRARRMLDWMVAIQLPGGGFQGGTVLSKPVVPVTFNTGQILIGLASGVAKFGEPYEAAMHEAASWLSDTLDEDGCWRKYPTPFAEPGEKAYETHVSWGLFEAAAVSGEERYAEAGLKNLHWALSKQKDNGWFSDCCLSDPDTPLTHTLGYVLRGILEAYRYSQEPFLLAAALRTAEGLLEPLQENGSLPGMIDRNWRGTVPWVCLTGNVQIAYCWLKLYQETGDERFRDAGFSANRYVRQTINMDGPPEICGGIKGSFPVSGDYGQFEYLNWAAKFFIDANRLERTIRGG